jgi:hypothetical protein
MTEPRGRDQKKQATHMLARGSHGLIIDRETNFAAQLGQQRLLDSRLEVLVASLWILTRFGTRMARLQSIDALGIAGARLRFDYGRLNPPIGY